jgi:hypothetical protein
VTAEVAIGFLHYRVTGRPPAHGTQVFKRVFILKLKLRTASIGPWSNRMPTTAGIWFLQEEQVEAATAFVI